MEADSQRARDVERENIEPPSTPPGKPNKDRVKKDLNAENAFESTPAVSSNIKTTSDLTVAARMKLPEKPTNPQFNYDVIEEEDEEDVISEPDQQRPGGLFTPISKNKTQTIPNSAPTDTQIQETVRKNLEKATQIIKDSVQTPSVVTRRDLAKQLLEQTETYVAESQTKKSQVAIETPNNKINNLSDYMTNVDQTVIDKMFKQINEWRKTYFGTGVLKRGRSPSMKYTTSSPAGLSKISKTRLDMTAGRSQPQFLALTQGGGDS